MILEKSVFIALISVGYIALLSRAVPPVAWRTALKLLEGLIADRSSSVPSQQTDVRIDQDANDQQYQSQVRLLLAELGCQVVGSTEAQKFFNEATMNGLPSADNLRFCNSYITSFDRRLKHPIWVLEYYTAERKTREEHDRARLASGKRYAINERLMNQDVCSSDIAPQMPELDRGPWMKLEAYVNHLTKHSKKVYVITGSLYLPEDGSYTSEAGRTEEYVSYRLMGRVAIPTHLYKVIVYLGSSERHSIEAFVLPNSESSDGRSSLEDFRVDIHNKLHGVERSAGLLFFDVLDTAKLIKPNTVQFGFSPTIHSDGASSSSADPRD